MNCHSNRGSKICLLLLLLLILLNLPSYSYSLWSLKGEGTLKWKEESELHINNCILMPLVCAFSVSWYSFFLANISWHIFNNKFWWKHWHMLLLPCFWKAIYTAWSNVNCIVAFWRCSISINQNTQKKNMWCFILSDVCLCCNFYTKAILKGGN